MTPFICTSCERRDDSGFDNLVAALHVPRFIQNVAKSTVSKVTDWNFLITSIQSSEACSTFNPCKQSIWCVSAVQSQRDVELAATAASLHAHSHSSLIDEEAVSALKQQLGAAERSAGEAALLQAALFHFHLGPAENLRKANSYLDQVLRSRPQNSEARCLKAWIELSSADKGGGKRGSYGGRSSGADKALALFEEVLGGNERDLEAMLGQVKCWEVKKEYNRALEHVNQVRMDYI